MNKPPITFRHRYCQDPEYVQRILTNEIKWETRTHTRDECFMSAYKDLTYTYGSGEGVRSYNSVQMTHAVHALMCVINDELSTEFDICFLNRYINEQQALGWHSDNSPEIDQAHPIAVLSFGAERELWFREQGTRGETPHKLLLTAGSLLVMSAGMQQTWDHRIPKHSAKCGERFSLTYRRYNAK